MVKIDELYSPALLVWEDRFERNLDRMLEIAGSPERLRPHCKTHKTAEVIQILLDRGISKHKCATIAEAELLARAGVTDIFWAYPPVGPNISRVVQLLRQYDEIRLLVTADDPAALEPLSEQLTTAELQVEVLLDLDTGMHRTGVAPGARAGATYQAIAELPGLIPGGIHLYDGQNHQHDLTERTAAVQACWEIGSNFRHHLESQGAEVPRIVAGGTGSFPIFAQIKDAALELSPGTCVFHDAGYAQQFPDLPFEPAAMILTRVISRPTEDRVTFDLGYKACAADPPLNRRVVFPDLPDAQIELQNEEHLVISTKQADRFLPGDFALAIPWHVCPTCAAHREIQVVRGEDVIDTWTVLGRDRMLTV